MLLRSFRYENSERERERKKKLSLLLYFIDSLLLSRVKYASETDPEHRIQ